ncbi:19536_t:CDS:1, partial [Cetraspora pellucida]
MFVENGFEIYEYCEVVKIEIPKKIEADKALKNRHLVVNELMKRTYNTYWRVEDKGSSKEKSEFIKNLK